MSLSEYESIPSAMNRVSISKEQKRKRYLLFTCNSNSNPCLVLPANEVVENSSPEQRLARGAELADF